MYQRLLIIIMNQFLTTTKYITHLYLLGIETTDTYKVLISIYNPFYFMLQTSKMTFEVVCHICSCIYSPVSSKYLQLFRMHILLAHASLCTGIQYITDQHTHACAGIICTFLKQLVLQQQQLIAEWLEPFRNPRHWWLVRLVNGSIGEQNRTYLLLYIYY